MKEGIRLPESRKRLGEILLDGGWITREYLETVLEIQKREGGRLGKILLEKELVVEGTLLEVLSSQLEVPLVDLSRAGEDPDAVSLLSYAVAKRYRALPLEKRDRVLHVAMVEPQDPEAVQALEFASGMRVRAGLCSAREIDIAVEQCYGMGEAVERIVRNVTREACLDEAAASIVLEEKGEGEAAGELEGNSPFLWPSAMQARVIRSSRRPSPRSAS